MKKKKILELSKANQGDIPVAFPITPISTGGIANMIHPNAAANDNICALPGVFVDKTR